MGKDKQRMNTKYTYDRIMQLVEDSGKSLRQVEKEADVANGTIGKMPKRDFLSVVTIKKLAEYFGKPIEYFVA